MPVGKNSIKITKFMSIRGQIILILALFLPICSLALMARWLSSDLGWMLFLLSLAWFVLAFLFFVIYRIRAKKTGKYTLSLENSHMRLFQGDRIIKEFNLAEKHRLLIVLSDFLHKKTLIFRRFADVHLSQGSERLSFRLYLIMMEAHEAPPAGEETHLSSAVEQKRVGNMAFLWITTNPYLRECQWECHYTGRPALNFLKALDSFSPNNALLPDIEKAKAGGMSLGKLKRMAMR